MNSIQEALSQMLAALGFGAMSRDVKTETDKARLSKYARIILKNSPEAQKHEIATRFYTLNLSETMRLVVKATLRFTPEEMRAIDQKSFDAWDQAYDASLAADRANGRRYDQDRYAEAASKARLAVYCEALEGGEL